MEPKMDKLGGIDKWGGIDLNEPAERQRFIDQFLNVPDDALDSVTFLSDSADKALSGTAIVFRLNGRVIKITTPEANFNLSEIDGEPLRPSEARQLWEKFKPLYDKYIQKP